MLHSVRIRTLASGGAAVLSLLLALPGCGSGGAGTATAGMRLQALASGTPASCQAAVLATLTTGVLGRVYQDGLTSERTRVARHLIASPALSAAVQSGQAPAVQQLARQLVGTGRVTALRITAGGRTLASVGTRSLAPLSGTIDDSSGKPIASYTASVWSDSSFLIEGTGITGGMISIRSGGRSVAGSPGLSAVPLKQQGTVTLRSGTYQYDSLPAELYPSGAARIYLLRPVGTTTPLCGSDTAETVVDTVRRVAREIYEAELGPRALAQVARVEADTALAEAVSRREPAAVRAAISSLLNEHIVRLRVISRGLLVDVGGPFVLAPVQGTIRLHGRAIGRFLLSVQDDEGYRRLTERLAGLRVLMYMDGVLVKNSLGPQPGAVPVKGLFEYRGRAYRVFTLHLKAFPTGTLLVRVLVPVPTRRAQTAASDSRFSRSEASSSSKEPENFSTPSRSSVSVRSS